MGERKSGRSREIIAEGNIKRRNRSMNETLKNAKGRLCNVNAREAQHTHKMHAHAISNRG